MKTYIPNTVCLIIPPSPFLLDERVFMSLGILKVAAVLERAGFLIEVLDLSGIENYLDVVEDHLRNSCADTIGITATTPQLPAAVRIGKTVKAVQSNVRLILGGPHVTLVNAALKQEQKLANNFGRARKAMDELERHFDVLVAGDGEEAIFIACGQRSPKLIDADDPKSTLYLSNQKLNELPMPARHLVDVESYHYSIDGVKALSLIAQLGCPFNCGFCGGRESPMLRRIRMRTAENIVEEMVTLYMQYGCLGFMFYDDELNVNRGIIELMNKIADAQHRLGVEWRLRGFIKAQLFTDEQASAMWRAGFRWILTGFESGSPRILENINKRSTLEENNRCIEIARRRGIKVKALMSIGHPGESFKTVDETHLWLMEVAPDDFDVTIISCYPGSPYYDQAVPLVGSEKTWVYTYKKTGDQLYEKEIDYTCVADYYKGNPDGGYVAYVFTDEMSELDLITARDKIERDVRKKLGISFNPSLPAIRYEHSMGMHGGILPPHILRQSVP